MSLANGLSILYIFSKNHLLVLLIFAIVPFVSFSLLSCPDVVEADATLRGNGIEEVSARFPRLPVVWDDDVQRHDYRPSVIVPKRQASGRW